MSFATLAGVLWGLAITGATIWVGLRVRAGAGTWVLLLASLLIVPWVPSPHAPIRSERMLYAGPDLLSDIPVRPVAVGDSVAAMGLARVSRVRRIQGVTLLSESRRVQLRLPWLWAIVVVAVGLWGRGATRSGGRRTGSRGSVMRALVALGVGAAASGACNREAAPSLAELRLKEVMEMRGTGDVGGIESVFLPEAVYEDVAGDFEYRGVPEIAGHLEGLHDWASGVFLDVVQIYVGPDWASAEWLLEGTQSGLVPGRLDTITGRRFRLRGVTLVEVERGGVVRAVDYLDWVPFLLDVGAEIHWPGGGVTSHALPPDARPEPGASGGGGGSGG